MLPSSPFCLGNSFTSTDLSFLITSHLLGCWGPAAVGPAGLQSSPLIPEREGAEGEAGNLEACDKRVTPRQARGRAATREQEE